MGIFRQRKAYFNSTMLRNGEKESAFKNDRILSLYDSQFDIQYDIQYESYDCDESKLMTNDFQMLVKMEEKNGIMIQITFESEFFSAFKTA